DELPVLDREDRVPAPLGGVACAALCLAAAAPLVGKDDLAAVVVEGRGVPVREVRVGSGVDPHRIDRIADVEQQAVAFTRTAGESDCRVDGDVVDRKSVV